MQFFVDVVATFLALHSLQSCISLLAYSCISTTTERQKFLSNFEKREVTLPEHFIRLQVHSGWAATIMMHA